MEAPSGHNWPMAQSPRNGRQRGKAQPPTLYVGLWFLGLGLRPVDAEKATNGVLKQSYLSQLINQKQTKSPRAEIVFAIADFMGIPADWLRTKPTPELLAAAHSLRAEKVHKNQA